MKFFITFQSITGQSPEQTSLLCSHMDRLLYSASGSKECSSSSSTAFIERSATNFYLAPSSQATVWCYSYTGLDNTQLPFPDRGMKKKVTTLFTTILQESICQQLRYHLQHKYPSPTEIRPCCLISWLKMPYPWKAAKPASTARLHKPLSIWGLGDGKFGAWLPKQTPFWDRDASFYEKQAVLTEPETLSVGTAQPPGPPGLQEDGGPRWQPNSRFLSAVVVQTPLTLTIFLAKAVGTAAKPSKISLSITPCNLSIILLGKGPEV